MIHASEELRADELHCSVTCTRVYESVFSGNEATAVSLLGSYLNDCDDAQHHKEQHYGSTLEPCSRIYLLPRWCPVTAGHECTIVTM